MGNRRRKLEVRNKYLLILSENLKHCYHNVVYKTFMTSFGHEAWIVDGKRFYEFIKEDLYM